MTEFENKNKMLVVHRGEIFNPFEKIVINNSERVVTEVGIVSGGQTIFCLDKITTLRLETYPDGVVEEKVVTQKPDGSLQMQPLTDYYKLSVQISTGMSPRCYVRIRDRWFGSTAPTKKVASDSHDNYLPWIYESWVTEIGDIISLSFPPDLNLLSDISFKFQNW